MIRMNISWISNKFCCLLFFIVNLKINFIRVVPIPGYQKFYLGHGFLIKFIPGWQPFLSFIWKKQFKSIRTPIGCLSHQFWKKIYNFFGKKIEKCFLKLRRIAREFFDNTKSRGLSLSPRVGTLKTALNKYDLKRPMTGLKI